MNPHLKHLAVAVCLVLGTSTPTEVAAATWTKCSVVNAKYPGGVAKSKTSKNLKTVSGKKQLAISKFRPLVSSSLYAQMKGLDRDGDGIACEK